MEVSAAMMHVRLVLASGARQVFALSRALSSAPEGAMLDERGIEEGTGSSPRRGDGAGLARDFFLRYHDFVLRFFRRQGFTDADARELTGEVFLRVSQNIEKLRSLAAAGAWLRRIMATVWKNELRRRQAIKRDAREVSLEAEREGGNEDIERRPSIGALLPPDPLGDVLSLEHLAAVRGCLGELPPRMRVCLVLFAFQERPYQEIADLLHVSLETVKSHIFQARQRVHACVAGRASGTSGRVP